MTAYGFIVVAWLVLPFHDGGVAIPFASLKACDSAKIHYETRLASYRGERGIAFCVPSGWKSQ